MIWHSLLILLLSSALWKGAYGDFEVKGEVYLNKKPITVYTSDRGFDQRLGVILCESTIRAMQKSSKGAYKNPQCTFTKRIDKTAIVLLKFPGQTDVWDSEIKKLLYDYISQTSGRNYYYGNAITVKDLHPRPPTTKATTTTPKTTPRTTTKATTTVKTTTKATTQATKPTTPKATTKPTPATTTKATTAATTPINCIPQTPAPPGGTGKPVVPGGTGKPVVPGGTGKPVTPGGTGKPVVPGGTGKPVVPGGTTQPGKPLPPGVTTTPIGGSGTTDKRPLCPPIRPPSLA